MGAHVDDDRIVAFALDRDAAHGALAANVLVPRRADVRPQVE